MVSARPWRSLPAPRSEPRGPHRAPPPRRCGTGTPPLARRRAGRSGGSSSTGEARRCQVEGCGVELGGAKGYHWKHSVCEAHSMCPRVVVVDQERRFCHQYSRGLASVMPDLGRFHALSMFDQNKQSCWGHLSDHNARWQKPQLDVFSFCSEYYHHQGLNDRREIRFVWNKAPFSDVRPFSYSSWPSNFKLSQVLDVGEKSIKAGAVNGQIHLPNSNLSYSFPTLYHYIDELLPIKGADSSGAASKLSGAPDVRRVLSLLSASSWFSADPVQKTTSLIHFTGSNQNSMISPISNGGNSNPPFKINAQPRAPESQVIQFTVDTGSTAFQDLKKRIKPAYDSTLFSMNWIR